MPIVGRLILVYKLWHEFLPHFPKTLLYTLGFKIDSYFLEILENIFIASYLNKERKPPYLQKAAAKLDLLKFFLQISWEIKALNTKKYIAFSEQLNDIGKMLGGWIRGVAPKKNPVGDGGE